MDTEMKREIVWRHIVLGNSWDTSCSHHRAEFLHELSTDDSHCGIWFDGAAEDDDDGQLVADILTAISRNRYITALCFRNMKDKMPIEWLAGDGGMLSGSTGIQELRIKNDNYIKSESADILACGIKKSASLRTLYLDFPSVALLKALDLALAEGEALKFETLDIMGIPDQGHLMIASILRYCENLKELELMAGSNLDSYIDKFVAGLDSMPLLQDFTFGFKHASAQAYSKLLHALATKDLKYLKFGACEDQIVLSDSSSMELMLSSNRNLQVLRLVNVEMKDMSGISLALLDNGKLKEISLKNVVKTAQNARDLARALSGNKTGVEKLTIECTGDNFEHEPFVRSLSDGLRNSHNLTNVSLYLNTLTDLDLRFLSVALEENSLLKSLEVALNKNEQVIPQIDSGLARLAQALIHNKALQNLDLKLDVSVSEATTRALLDAVKVNPSLQTINATWLNTKEQKELDFLIKLNRGPKQSLHLPLALMPYAFARADQCRVPVGDAAQRSPPVPFNRLLLEDSDGDDPVDAVDFLTSVFSNRDKNNNCEEALLPPNELFFFVRERCDLFQDAGRDKSNRGSELAWLCCLFGRR